MITRLRRSSALAALLLAMQVGATSSAHTLDTNTARITLRDEHIEVILEADLLSLIGVVNPKLPDATALAIADDFAFGLAVQKTKDLLQSGSHLIVDGVASPLTVTGFPSAGEVRYLAAYASANQQAHPELVALRLEATKPARGARTIALTLPKEAGAVLFTFIQPATRLAAAGERVAFPVLIPQAGAGIKQPASGSK